MGPVGFPELLVIFVIALIVFGPRKLPEIAKAIGKSLAEFRRASNELKRTLEEEIRIEERRDAVRQEAPRAIEAPRPGDAPRAVESADTIEATPAASIDHLGNVPRQNGSA
ncbi:MAG: Sec-independent protein translocase protein TatB [Vicinamibacterales bacterium]